MTAFTQRRTVVIIIIIIIIILTNKQYSRTHRRRDIIISNNDRRWDGRNREARLFARPAPRIYNILYICIYLHNIYYVYNGY